MADTVRCYAAASLAPGSFAMRQPERGQKTHPHSEVAYVSVGARHPRRTAQPTKHTPAPQGGAHPARPTTALTRPKAQLDQDELFHVGDLRLTGFSGESPCNRCTDSPGHWYGDRVPDLMTHVVARTCEGEGVRKALEPGRFSRCQGHVPDGVTVPSASEAIEATRDGWTLPIPTQAAINVRPSPALHVHDLMTRQSHVEGDVLPPATLRYVSEAFDVLGRNPSILVVREVGVFAIVLRRLGEVPDDFAHRRPLGSRRCGGVEASRLIFADTH